MIDPDVLPALLEPAEPALSILFPMATDQRDQRAPDARFRQLLGEAEERLAHAGLDEADRRSLLAPAEDAGRDFTRHRDPGLAFYLAQGREPEIVALPDSPADCVVVGRHFHLKPLLPVLARNRRFFVLALSSANARLLRATPFAWEELALAALPPDAQAELDSLPAVGGPAPDETRRRLVTADAHRVAHAVRAAIGTDPAPIVLAAEPQVAGHFTKSAQLPQLLAEGVSVNPFALTDADLHARALAVIAPALETEAEILLDQVNARLGTAEATVAIRLEEILAAAQEGRVDAVAVAADAVLWGRWQAGETVAAHGHQAPGDEDLLNLAAVLAMRTGARAYALPGARLPRQSPAVATLRF